MRYENLEPVGTFALPEIGWHPSPNRSSRNGRRARLVFVHVWGGGSFDGVVGWLCNPNVGERRASSHVVYAGERGKDAGRCTQLVPWAEKAWTQCELNPVALSVESADQIWNGQDPDGFAVLARIVAGLCHFHLDACRYVDHTGIVAGAHGFTFHRTAGALGCGHAHCPSDDAELLDQFKRRVIGEYREGGWRRVWGR